MIVAHLAEIWLFSDGYFPDITEIDMLKNDTITNIEARIKNKVIFKIYISRAVEKCPYF